MDKDDEKQRLVNKDAIVKSLKSKSSPFQAWEAQIFLSIPSRLFSLPAARHGYSLGKAARRELIFNFEHYISDLLARQIQNIHINTEANAG